MRATMTEAAYRAVLAEVEQFDIIRVRWRDSSRIGLGWDKVSEYARSIDESMNDLEESTGYFVASNDAYVLIVQSLRQFAKEGLETTVTDGMMIPHEAIRLFEIIRKGKDLDRRTGVDLNTPIDKSQASA